MNLEQHDDDSKSSLFRHCRQQVWSPQMRTFPLVTPPLPLPHDPLSLSPLPRTLPLSSSIAKVENTCLRVLEKKTGYGPTDGQTEGQTDGQTDRPS